MQRGMEALTRTGTRLDCVYVGERRKGAILLANQII